MNFTLLLNPGNIDTMPFNKNVKVGKRNYTTSNMTMLDGKKKWKVGYMLPCNGNPNLTLVLLMSMFGELNANN